MTRKLRSCMRLIFACILVLALGTATGTLAQNAKSKKKPILTKSAKKEAVWKAAQEVLAIKQQQKKTTAGIMAAMPANPTDPTKVPHYFGPFPNWANSPFTLPDATVTINGDGTGATAQATVGAQGAITGINITNPGVGYTQASVQITSAAGTGAAAVATVSTSGIVSGITVDAAGAGYSTPTVTLSGGAGITGAVLTQVGNPLVDRAFGSDLDSAAQIVPDRVFIVVPSPLPAGTLKSFMSRNQATPGIGPIPSAGRKFNAYLLRPVLGAPNQYSVVFDSGTLVVPPLTNPGVSENVTYPVPDTVVQAGDVIAFYGSGIPFDRYSGVDIVTYPVPAAPTTGSNINIGSSSYPLVAPPNGARTYSFGAAVVADHFGNPLSTRAYGSDLDSVTQTVPDRIFVIVPTPLPAGTLTGFLSFNQATPGVGPIPSAGRLFNAYVLRPGPSNQYSVVYDSGQKVVPPLTTPGVSEIVTYPVPNVPVQSGDVIGFYGSGIPFDRGGGSDIVAYPVPAAPLLGNVFTIGSSAFPLVPPPNGARSYAFGANVTASASGTGATATAYGGVDAVVITGSGSGYSMPTIDFDLPDDPNGVPAVAHVPLISLGDPINGIDAQGRITAIIVDSPGSGYAAAPNLVIRDGTIFNPIPNGGTGATARATISLQYVTVNTFGAGYVAAPTVTIADSTGTGAGAAATATINSGGVTRITLTSGGINYVTQGGIKKFQDGLPVLCLPGTGQTYANCTNNNLGQHIPIAVPDTTTFSGADYYVIAVVQHRERMSSSLPATGTLVREYVQLETPANASISKHVPLQNVLLNGTTVPARLPNGAQAYAVDDPHFLGPIISAAKDRPVRIVFYNLLPAGVDGDLFIPVDSTLYGSGLGPETSATQVPVDQGSVMDSVRNQVCTETPKDSRCYKDNRATLHLHGGLTPWISDGTPHQWITPATETTPYPEGVSVGNVPDMANVPGVPDCSAERDGCQTFYYTNQQSARLLFYHDHAWGITRLNVYAGEAAGYLISDAVEQRLITNGIIPSDQIPLVIQDRTFVPNDQQLAAQDPTWDSTRWGSFGNFWYHHVYMPAQNPGDPSGMSAYGRWMYGPWFWPPAGTALYQPIANPYYNPSCRLDDPATWTYNTDPFCEPPLIPSTPNISAGMEQFNDTPLVNGTAYPTLTVQPKSYRLRILNAANDRFWNLQWYLADPRTRTDSEVALNAAELAAAQTDPNVVPTPDTAISPPGPNWIQIGTEGGFLPAPVVIPNQPITWIIDPTRFDVGNVDKHSLLLAPAERADVIVDFSRYAGQTLILYNDAPAAFPARVASYDYYTGAPDLSPVGAPQILPGFGPNTRTIMQVKVVGVPAPAFNLTALQAAFRHKADGSGVFESGQHPIIVGQATYNSAYGTNFAASSWCNAPGSTINLCDGMARISEQGGDAFGFNTLAAPTSKLSLRLEPKAIHDEMNATAFDEFGRMQANMGLEAVPANPAAQNFIAYPYSNPPSELIDGTNLPKGGLTVAPISAADGSQIWKITHNGVDTHPIHFHLYDVQLLNRVTWDNIIIPPDANELGWKDTVRVSPLEDTIVALRPVIPTLPFELPNSIRVLNPWQPLGSVMGFANINAAGNPTAPITNQLINFGWEYVWHCHILSHEEMDMMRPQSVAIPPIAPSGLTYSVGTNGLTLNWTDNSITETSFTVQKLVGGVWVDAGTILSPLDQPNTHGARTFLDAAYRTNPGTDYRVVAKNTVGYGGEYMSMTAQSISSPVTIANPPLNPTNLTATLQAGPQISLTWTDNATNETGFVVERSTNGGAFVQIATRPARTNTGSVTYVDTTIALGNTYAYRVAATNANGNSGFSNTATIAVPTIPQAPTGFTAANAPNQGNQRSVNLTWTDNSNNETGFRIERSTNNATWTLVTTTGPNVTAFTVTGLSRNTDYYFRIRAESAPVVFSNWVSATPSPIRTNP